MDKGIKSFRVLSFAKRNLTSYGEIYLVEATPQNNELTRKFLDDMCITDEFRLASNSLLINGPKVLLFSSFSLYSFGYRIFRMSSRQVLKITIAISGSESILDIDEIAKYLMWLGIFINA